MNQYYLYWLEATRKIDHMQLIIFVAVAVGYLLYRFNFRRFFWWGAAAFGAVVGVFIGAGVLW